MMAWLLAATAAAALCISDAAGAECTAAEHYGTEGTGKIVGGGYIRNANLPTMDLCRELCLDTAACNSFQYHLDKKECGLRKTTTPEDVAQTRTADEGRYRFAAKLFSKGACKPAGWCFLPMFASPNVCPWHGEHALAVTGLAKLPAATASDRELLCTAHRRLATLRAVI